MQWPTLESLFAVLRLLGRSFAWTLDNLSYEGRICLVVILNTRSHVDILHAVPFCSLMLLFLSFSHIFETRPYLNLLTTHSLLFFSLCHVLCHKKTADSFEQNRTSAIIPENTMAMVRKLGCKGLYLRSRRESRHSSPILLGDSCLVTRVCSEVETN